MSKSENEIVDDSENNDLQNAEEVTQEAAAEGDQSAGDEVERVKAGMLKRINKLSEREKLAIARAEKAEQEIAQAQAARQQQPSGVLQAPTLEGCGYDEQVYQAKVAEYHQLNLQRELAIAQQRAEAEKQQAELQQKIQARQGEFRSRAASLNIEGFDKSEEIVRGVLGDAALNEIILNVDKSSELVAYLANNPSELMEFSEIAETNAVAAYQRIGEIVAKNFGTKPPQKAKPEADEIPENTSTPDDRVKKLAAKVAAGKMTMTEFREAKKRIA